MWDAYEKKQEGGQALKTFRPEGKLPMVTGGAYTIKQYEKKGTTIFIPDPNYYGPKSNADAVALTYYTNSDSMIADLRRGNLDWIDQVPFNAVNAVKKSKGVKVNGGRAARSRTSRGTRTSGSSRTASSSTPA